MPFQSIVPVSNVIGYDMVINYDATKVVPTGLITIASDLINPQFVSYATSGSAGVLNVSVFLNGAAPSSAQFNGTGRLLCVEFAKLSTFAAVDTVSFSVPSLQESYFSGVSPKVVSPGTFLTTQSNTFTADLRFWADNSAIPYNSSNASQYLITNIYGTTGACTSLSATAVQPDASGSFSFDASNGSFLNIQRDISNTSSVQAVVNGFDAFLTRRVLINDPNFIPTIYQIIAMDVNADGVISAGDLSQINQRAVLAIGEYRQSWNYNAQGVSNGQPSKDWLFVDATTVNTSAAYQISTTYPSSDGVGYSKSNVPQVSFCSPIPVFTAGGGCQAYGNESYKGILVGDVNGNYATASVSDAIRTENLVVFDAANAVVSGSFIDVPVRIKSTSDVYALDFSIETGSSISFHSVINNGHNMEMLVNKTGDIVRFTSFSLQHYNTSGDIVYLRFNGKQSDVASIAVNETYVNGDRSGSVVTGQQNTSSLEVNVYPNPSTETINVLASEDFIYELMDISGRVILSGSLTKAFDAVQISTNGISNGVYNLKVISSNSAKIVRVSVKK